MYQNDVPQDNISTYANNTKAIYATDAEGHYNIVASSGWEVEGEATTQALQELKRLADQAYTETAAGKKSPLYFHMYNCRMDLQVLAEATGLFKWRIKRHFRPAIFRSLSPSLLARYGSALGLCPEELCRLPERNRDYA